MVSAGTFSATELLDSSTAELSGAAEDRSTVPADYMASLDKAVSLEAGAFPAFTSVETLLELLSAQAARKNRDEKIQARESFFIKHSVSAKNCQRRVMGRNSCHR